MQRYKEKKSEINYTYKNTDKTLLKLPYFLHYDYLCQLMEKYNGDIINPEYVEHILNDIKNGNSPYIDIYETEDAFDFLMQDIRSTDANILIEHALRIHPDSNELMLLRARLLIDGDSLREARQLLSYLEPTSSNNPDFFVSYGWLELKSNDIHKAINYFDKACQIDEEMYYEIGLNLNQFGNHEEAKRFLVPYVNSHPNDPEALFELAYAYEKTEMTEKAKITYEDLVDRKPFYPAAWYNLGIIYNNEGEYDKAIMAYDTAVTITPEYPEPYFNMGNTYMNIMQYEKALNCYLEYASLCLTSEQDNSVMQYIAECWWELGNYDLARRFYLKAIDFMPDNPPILYGYALCNIELNNNSEALNTLNNLIEIDPDGAEYHFAKAQVYYNMMDKKSAYQSLLNGIELDPEAVLAWNEVLRFCVATYGENEVAGIFKKFKSQYGHSWAFKFITFVVQYCFESKPKSALKTLADIAQNNSATIYDAAEDENIHNLLMAPDCVQICQKYNIKLDHQ